MRGSDLAGDFGENIIRGLPKSPLHCEDFCQISNRFLASDVSHRWGSPKVTGCIQPIKLCILEGCAKLVISVGNNNEIKPKNHMGRGLQN